MELDFGSIIQNELPFFAEGALVSIKLTALAVFIGIIIGVFVGLGRLSNNIIIKGISSIYVEVIRGTPLLVQILIIYYGLPQILGFKLPMFLAAVASLGINSGGYVAEIVRAGIQSIDKGQMEAAQSLGMSYVQAMRYIILPQAFKRIIPPLGNEFITLLKNSSLLTAIGYSELTRRGQIIASVTYKPFEPLITVAVFYLIMTTSFSKILNIIERRLRVSD